MVRGGVGRRGGRLPPVHHAEQRTCSHQSSCSAQQRQNYCLGHQLPNESPTARTESHAQRQFFAAIGRTRRKQAGQIRASRDQNEQRQPSYAVKKSANDVTVVCLESWTDQPQRHPCIRLWIFLR